MSLTVTMMLLAASISVIAFANWRERGERPLGKAPLVSYPVLQMIGIVLAILLLAHLVSLLTGQPLRGQSVALTPIFRSWVCLHFRCTTTVPYNVASATTAA